MAASNSMMSARVPLGGFFLAGGPAETFCSHSVPGVLVVSLKTFSLEAETFLVLSLASNFFHSVVRPLISTLAKLVLPSALSMLTVTGPTKPAAAFAKKETVYVVWGLTGMPQ